METLDQYRVQFDAYSGPLDLLLYLVRRREVDITAISLASVAGDYLRCLELMSTLNVDVAGDFLVIAATLMEIKSRTLLPTPPPEADEEWEDPCEELVKQLIEYRRFREAADALGEKADERAMRVERPAFVTASAGLPAEAADSAAQAGAEELHEVSLWDLMEAFGKLLEATGATKPLSIVVDSTPQELVIERLLARFGDHGAGEVALSHLLDREANRGVLISTFLAILELVKRGVLRAVQIGQFGEIRLVRCASSCADPPSPSLRRAGASEDRPGGAADGGGAD